MTQEPTGLSSIGRLLLSVSALALVAGLAALQCSAFSVDADLRAGLSTVSMLLSALVAAVLVEDAIGASLRSAFRRVLRGAEPASVLNH